MNNNNIWDILEGKTQEEIRQLLTEKLGEPNQDNKIANFLLNDITRKLFYNFHRKDSSNNNQRVGNIHVIQAKITSIEEKQEKQRSINAGELYYHVYTEDGKRFSIRKNKIQREEIWKEVQAGTCIGKSYIIKYTKWINIVNIVNWERTEDKNN